MPSRILAGACCLAAGAAAVAGPAYADPAAGERPVYVTDADQPGISIFTADVATGRPTLSHGLAPAGDGVRQMAFTPDARMAYAANSEVDTISVYRVGPHGRLTQLAGDAGAVPSGGVTPLGVTVTPDGHTLFAAHVDSSTVAAFTIAADGTLVPFRTITASVANPRGLALTPDGRFLYAGHGDTGPDRPTSAGAVTAYAVGRDGSLTPAGAPVRVGRFCGDLAITPDGGRLYLICQDTDEIYGFAIGPGGGLTPLPRSPYTVSDFPEGITISPDGRFVYTASLGLGHEPEGPGAVSGFAIGGDGALTPVPGSPFAAGQFPVGITVLPNSRFVYASGGDTEGELDAFRIGAGGTLLPLHGSPFDTGGLGPAYGSASVLPNQGPVAGFTARTDGRSAAFDASASTDSDGRVARYRWDFGDGSTQATDGPRTEHRYPRAGTFRVTVTVTDNEGCSAAHVSTGRQVLCNGTAAATTTRDVVVPG